MLYGLTRVNINDNSALTGPGKAYNLPKDTKSSETPIRAIYIKEDSKSIILKA